MQGETVFITGGNSGIGLASSIVNVSSIVGIRGLAGAGFYVASKHAVIGLTRSAALEYANQNIRINCVSPAGVKTAMYDRFLGNEQNQEAFSKAHPIGRCGQPKEIAEAVIWLCSEKSSFVTGTNLVLDGGLTSGIGLAR